MPSEEAIDRMLNRIPGYSGYRDKERRRDSDRVIRDQLALEYGQLADRLGRLATSLADERQIAAIAAVDKPYKRMTAFIDRVRTAPYGYAPLFSDAPVDEDALDQVALFDRSLADQQAVLAEQISSLEGAEPGSQAFRDHSDTIVATVETLHERFDKRQEVIHAGKALPHKDVVALLDRLGSQGSPVAYRLHENDAVSYAGVNYSVVGRVSIEASESAWRAFQLRGGVGDAWLIVSAFPEQPIYWTQRVSLTSGTSGATVSVAGTTYNRESVSEGSGEVIGASGSATNQPVRLTRYRAAAGEDVLFVFAWESGSLALAGVEVDAASLEIFSREQ